MHFFLILTTSKKITTSRRLAHHSKGKSFPFSFCPVMTDMYYSFRYKHQMKKTHKPSNQ